jgi:hypothetical protein
MRRVILIVLAVMLVASVAAFSGDHAFVGVNKCKMCHQREAKGMIYEKWTETAHSKAFETLASDESKAVYAKLGKTGDPRADAECLACHTVPDTAFYADGVGCEACHGAGGDYWKMTVMKDKDAAVAAGLILDPSTGCVRCHNEKSPTFKGFNFEEMYPKIEHHIPVAAE